MALDPRQLKNSSLRKFYENLVLWTARNALCPNLLEKFLFKVNIQEPKKNF